MITPTIEHFKTWSEMLMVASAEGQLLATERKYKEHRNEIFNECGLDSGMMSAAEHDALELEIMPSLYECNGKVIFAYCDKHIASTVTALQNRWATKGRCRHCGALLSSHDVLHDDTKQSVFCEQFCACCGGDR